MERIRSVSERVSNQVAVHHSSGLKPLVSPFCCFLSLQLNLVALNQPHSGDMMGLDTADRMCYEQAKAMGLAPNYRAFISSHRQDLVHVVYPGFRETLPVTNLRVHHLLFGTKCLKENISASNPPCLAPLGRRDVQELAVYVQW